MEKKPNVFPTNQQTNNEEVKQVSVDSDYEAKRLEVAGEIYNNSMGETGMSAVEAMRKRTEEQMRLRDEQLKKNIENTQSYQDQYNYAKEREPNPAPPQYTTQETYREPVQQTVLKSEPKPIINDLPLNMTTHQKHVEQLSQPQYNAAFDVIPLPSEGKLYKNKKASVKVAYMTTADENILTSPNLLQSGEFLEILINRKLLDSNLRYKDLHVGDRNAIMLWLRATSYGEIYPVTMYDEDGSQFEYDIDLTKLKTIKLSVEPDAEGYFDFYLPVSKVHIKFKLLTVGDLDDIDKLIEQDEKNELPVVNINTYRLERQIVEVNGSRDKNLIRDFIQTLRIKDAKELKEYIEKIDCGVDLNIDVTTPRGGSISTFLPLNFKFFWPDFPL
jgi:hypothetical protein